MPNQCFSCTVGCCSTFVVFVNHRDAQKIVEHLGIPPEDAFCAVSLTKEFPDYQPYAFSLGGKKRYLLALRRKQRHCQFIIRLPSGISRCAIHSVRPGICRCYPFSVNYERLKAVRQMICTNTWRLSPAEVAEQKRVFEERVSDDFQYQAFLDTWHSAELPSLIETLPRRIPPERNSVFATFCRFLLQSSPDRRN